METYIIRITHQAGSKRARLSVSWYPHGERMGARGKAECHADNVDAEYGEQEMWEMMLAVRDEIESWQRPLPLAWGD